MGERNLYLHTISVEEALSKYYNYLQQNKIQIGGAEFVKTEDALGRITCEAVYAKSNSPLFNAAAMDGICVESKITKGASEENPIVLNLGKDFLIVDTGDAIKSPYDAVIMAEDVIEIDDTHIKIVGSVPEWENVRPVGEDIVTGEMIIPSNHKISPIDIGAILASGNLNISCYKKIKVGIIPTGTEIIDPKEKPMEGDIIDSNSYMIKSLVDNSGGVGKRYGIVKDDYELIKQQVKKSIEENDITITNAGSSAGTKDFTVHILRELGEVIVHGVAMKPGKPVILAIVKGKPVIGLPGYPLSAYLAYDIFVKPLIENKVNLDNKISNHNIIKAKVAKRIVSSLKHKEYVRAKVGKVNGEYIASPLNRGAASQMSMVRADGLLIIPKNSEGVEAGEKCIIELLKNKNNFDNIIVSIGSHDMLMDIVADILAYKYKNIILSSTHVGSMGGLMALKRGETIIAPTHLLDESTGEYNINIIKELFNRNDSISLIKGFNRIQGIMVKKGNPLGIKGINDLTKYRFVNRQRGAGTRVLLDYLLKKNGIDFNLISGYDKEVTTHMAVAACVKSDDIDFGLGVKSAADSMNLDFIEVGVEEYDFAIRTKDLEDEKIKAFIEVISGNELRKKLDNLGGYSYSNVGKIIKDIN
ncbi:MAG: molybdopterin biosynthesis protein [Eubacteriales bacterium]|nr:molybdopterin biosynthesis protein [Eubacteriales bacterium]